MNVAGGTVIKIFLFWTFNIYFNISLSILTSLFPFLSAWLLLVDQGYNA